MIALTGRYSNHETLAVIERLHAALKSPPQHLLRTGSSRVSDSLDVEFTSPSPFHRWSVSFSSWSPIITSVARHVTVEPRADVVSDQARWPLLARRAAARRGSG